MKRLPLAAMMFALCTQAQAHAVTAEVDGDAVVVLLPLAAMALVYTLGAVRLWSRAGVGRGVRVRDVCLFLAGLELLAAVVVSPLHEWSGRLFAAHMIEHEILMLVAAPLIVVARPLGVLLWGLPQGFRRGAGALGRTRVLSCLWRVVSTPLAATALHAVALWAWHAPALYEAALASATIHWLQHASFLLSAILFWHALIHARGGQGAAVFCLFATALHSGFLGILLAVARTPIYLAQSSGAAAWGLTALEDQQLAGIIMWVPAGCIYAAAALVFAGLWIARSSARLTPAATPRLVGCHDN
jgi:putative membrane protein